MKPKETLTMSTNYLNPTLLELDNYTIIRKIGEGGNGLVYKAKQLSTGQTVAVKLIKYNESSKPEEQLTQFEQEIKLSAEINHPNIVKIIERGFSKLHEPYAVYEYVQGKTLKEFIIANNGLSVIESAEIMGQILDALVYTHEKGILHRDLKPQNIMVCNSGAKNYVKILDYGIGVSLNDYNSTNSTSTALKSHTYGTPAYCAPEQLRGELPTIKTDFYAWGLLFLECITGKPAIQGNSVAEIFEQQLSSSFVAIPQHIAEHPLGKLLHRVLEKNPSKRPKNAKSIYNDLQNINLKTALSTCTNAQMPNNYEEEYTLVNSKTITAKNCSRKQITVLCMKLDVAISNNSSIDIETLDALQKDQLNICREIIANNNGFIGGSLLNNLIVYYGYPNSNELDSKNAGTTALELLRETEKRSRLLLNMYNASLNITISIHTGMALIHQNDIPDGNVPNTALHILRVAPIGNIILSAHAERVLNPFFECKRSEKYLFPNEKNEIQAYTLMREKHIAYTSPFELLKANRKLIGRKNERQSILDAWSNVCYNNGKAMLVSGQAGIGKSRLLYHIKQDLYSKAQCIEFKCMAEHKHNVLHPFFNELLNKIPTKFEDKSISLVKGLKHLLKKTQCSLSESMPILCSWMSLPVPKEYSTSEYNIEEQKRILFNTLKKCLFTPFNDKATLFIVEDLHWIDQTSKEFLEFILQDIANSSLFLVMSARPEFIPDWNFQDFSILNLNVFKKQHVKEIVENILEGMEIDNSVLEYIEKRSDGVPFFIEELTYMLKEQNFVKLEGYTYTLIDDIDTKTVPQTLHALLNTRLDKLSLSKETAQLASVIGRIFSYDLLIKSSAKDEASVQRDLKLMENANIVFRNNETESESYVFRHALISDVAYESIVTQQKKEYHKNVAQALETNFVSTTKTDPGLLAIHWSNAMEYKKAIQYGIAAANKSLSHSLNEETITYSQKVIEWIDTCPASDENDNIRLCAFNILTNALMSKYGWTARIVKDNADKTLKLLKKLGEKNVSADNAIASYWALITYFHVGGKRMEARMLTGNLQNLAKSIKNKDLEASAMILHGINNHAEGKLDKAITLFENILNDPDAERKYGNYSTIGIDNLVYASSMLGQILCYLDRKDEGMKRALWAIDRATNLKHIPSQCLAMLYKSVAHQFHDERHDVLTLTNKILGYAQKYNLPAYSAYATTLNFWANDQTESLDAVITQLENLGCKVGLSYYASLPAKSEFENGKTTQAINRINRCIAYSDTNKEYFYRDALEAMKVEFQNAGIMC